MTRNAPTRRRSRLARRAASKRARRRCGRAEPFVASLAAPALVALVAFVGLFAFDGAAGRDRGAGCTTRAAAMRAAGSRRGGATTRDERVVDAARCRALGLRSG